MSHFDLVSILQIAFLYPFLITFIPMLRRQYFKIKAETRDLKSLTNFLSSNYRKGLTHRYFDLSFNNTCHLHLAETVHLRIVTTKNTCDNSGKTGYGSLFSLIFSFIAVIIITLILLVPRLVSSSFLSLFSAEILAMIVICFTV